MSKPGEAYMPAAMILRVLECATDDVVLVGGQALAFWMDFYGVQAPGNAAPAVSRDVDFFTRDAANTQPLKDFARAIGGRVELPSRKAITALIGSAVAPAEESRVFNVDLLHSVVGLTRANVEDNSVRVSVPGTKAELRVMHPLDVLKSRNANLHQLADKQDEMGTLQFRLAIEVARAYLEQQLDALAQERATAAEESSRAVFDAIGTVSDYAAEDAARKNSERYGVFLADAIPAWRITAAAFWEKQWPHLRQRMSPGYARLCDLRAGRGPLATP